MPMPRDPFGDDTGNNLATVIGVFSALMTVVLLFLFGVLELGFDGNFFPGGDVVTIGEMPAPSVVAPERTSGSIAALPQGAR
ncbi:hypothetical protein [Mesorhizobium sp. 10J20-29]